MTFDEVSQLIREHGIEPAELNDEEFDPPNSLMGGMFPMGGGLIRVAGLPTDLCQNSVHHVEGRAEFPDLVSRLNQRVRGRISWANCRLAFSMSCSARVALTAR